MIGNYAELSVTLWLSCAIYLFFVNRKKNFLKRFLLASTGFCLGVAVIGLPVYLNLEVSFSMIRFGILYLLLCSAFFLVCADLKPAADIYCAVWALITQQIAYELCCIFIATVDISGAVSIIVCKTAVYLVIYGLAGLTFARFMPEKGSYHIGPRQLLSALFLWIVYELLFELLRAEEGLSAFSLQTWNILLIQGYCITILYLQNTMFKKSTMKQELDTLNQIWHQQKEQYELSKETIMLINHKCHDLKHQISAMRAITSPEEREKYLREVEDSVQIYDAMVQTGNEVLDTVLTEKSLFCAANNIKINCIVDGRQMDIFEPVDLYTIFGNALDNAIESVMQLEKQEMRMIDVLVYVRQQFLMINIMNPIGNQLEFEGELPVSTKVKNGYHGFGLKSIRHLIGKYNGFMKIDTEQQIFSLKLLIPLNRTT